MSSPLAIAAVTATLRNLLAEGIAPDAELADATITMQPPDRARPATATGNQLNLFLYQALPNAAWRNRNPPGVARENEPFQPPLALNLFYLLTAYGRDNDGQRPFSQMLLGRAMSILHDHPLLGAPELAAAMPGSDLGTLVERVRLTPQPMPLEDLSKLWTAFQSQFRASVAYEASVVLIDSQRPRLAPLPVLRRGEADQGPQAQGSALPALPEITGAEVGAGRLVIRGHDLAAPAEVLLEAPHHGFRRRFPAADLASGQASAPLPAGTPAGLLRLTLLCAGRPSNTLALSLAPEVAAGLPATLPAAGGELALTLAAPVLAGQPVAVLVAGQALAPVKAEGKELRCRIPALPPGDYPVRVRVDGLDSAVVADAGARPRRFDPQCLLTVTP